MTVLFGVAVTVWFAALSTLPAEQAQRIAMPGTVTLGFALPWLYFGALNGSNSGQTVGKRVAAIQVRHAETGEPLGVAKGLLRQAVVIGLALALTLPAVLNYLAPLWDAKRQAWHDKVVGSVVIALGPHLTEGDSQSGPDNPAPGSHPS